MITHVTHFTLFVKNQDEALSFYIEKLGFEVHTDVMFDSMRWLTINARGQKNFEIVLYLADKPENMAMVGKQGASEVLLCFASDNIDKDYQDLKARGVQFMGTPEDQPWGRSVVCTDLYGNFLYIVQSK